MLSEENEKKSTLSHFMIYFSLSLSLASVKSLLFFLDLYLTTILRADWYSLLSFRISSKIISRIFFTEKFLSIYLYQLIYLLF